MKLKMSHTGLLLFVILLQGCGNSGPPEPERAVVTGTVKFEGEPVQTGNISFTPEKGPVALGPVIDGLYQIDRKGGVPVGNCKVEIYGFKETGEEMIVGAGGRTEKVTRQIIPPNYNAASTIKVSIEAGQENHHDFDLK
tara:strand:- start:1026 stop:1442 length:417 start_codon:yes stop_codon:yes gene_type:complete